MLTILNILELIACIAGYLNWAKFKNTFWISFPVYLTFIVLAEMTGWYLATYNKTGNLAFYNYFEIPIEFLFFFWLFYRESRQSKYKWLPVVCGTLYFISWVFDMEYFSKQNFCFYSFSYTIGNLLLLVLILQFFISLVSSEKILRFRQNMMFWICTGLLIYYLGSFPYYGLRNTIAYKYRGINVAYSYIESILNCMMYIMFTLSFIFGKPGHNEIEPS